MTIFQFCTMNTMHSPSPWPHLYYIYPLSFLFPNEWRVSCFWREYYYRYTCWHPVQYSRQLPPPSFKQSIFGSKITIFGTLNIASIVWGSHHEKSKLSDFFTFIGDVRLQYFKKYFKKRCWEEPFRVRSMNLYYFWTFEMLTIDLKFPTFEKPNFKNCLKRL